jgi:hypothetical protein
MPGSECKRLLSSGTIEKRSVSVIERKHTLNRWKPAPCEPAKHTRLLPDDWAAEFEVTVPDSSLAGKGFSFRFDEVLAVRPVNESFRLMVLQASINPPCRTFKVEDSEWLESFHEKTYGQYQRYKIQHFVFISTSDVVVEVLSPAEPRIEHILLPATSRSE